MAKDQTSQNDSPSAPKLTYRVSTATTPHAADEWRHNLSEIVETSIPKQDEFYARLSIGAAAHGLLMETQSCAQTMERTPNLIRANEFDYLSMSVVQAGEHLMDVDGISTTLSPGDVFFTHHARPSTVAYAPFKCLRLHIPRAMAPIFFRESDINGVVLKQERAGTALLSRHIEGLWASLADLTQDEIAASVDAAFMIASGSLRAKMQLQPEHRKAVNRTVLNSIRAFIQDQLADPRLGPDVICTVFRISKSTLYRLFEHEGGVISYITACRLDRCWHKLRINGRDAGLISSLAYDCGFNSEVSFSRAFRRRFGVSPREVRSSFASARRGSADDAAQAVEGRILGRYRNIGRSAG